MKKTTITLTLVLILATMGAPGLAQSLESLTQPQKGKSMRASSGNPIDNADSEKFEIGQTKTIALLEGPGKIAHIWLVPSSMDIRYPRALVLRIYFDGAEVPSVEVPFGDFFGVGNGMRAIVDSLPVKVSSYGRGYNCYWQMPFAKEAKITIANESDKENGFLLFSNRLGQAGASAGKSHVFPRPLPSGVSAGVRQTLHRLYRSR